MDDLCVYDRVANMRQDMVCPTSIPQLLHLAADEDAETAHVPLILIQGINNTVSANCLKWSPETW